MVFDGQELGSHKLQSRILRVHDAARASAHLVGLDHNVGTGTQMMFSEAQTSGGADYARAHDGIANSWGTQSCVPR